MRVMVTGAAGLYGVHLIDKLVKRDDIERVYGVDNFSRNFFEKDPFIKSLEFEQKFRLIIKDYKDIDTHLINLLEIDAIIHFAAYVSIDESMDNPTEYFVNNEIGTFQFIQNIFKSKQQPYLIYASSPEVYGNPQYIPMDEKHPLCPRSTYAVTKLACEKHCLSLYEWYDYPVNVIRNFNTFGENQNVWGYSAVIPSFIERALKNKNLMVYGDGTQTRDFIYVKDAIEAYNLLLVNNHKVRGEIFNIGLGKQMSMNELAKMILKLIASRSNIEYSPGRKGDLFALEADITKAREILGWQPKYSLSDGLKNTINWYSKFMK